MYFPFTTAKNLTGFGADHSASGDAEELSNRACRG